MKRMSFRVIKSTSPFWQPIETPWKRNKNRQIWWALWNSTPFWNPNSSRAREFPSRGSSASDNQCILSSPYMTLLPCASPLAKPVSILQTMGSSSSSFGRSPRSTQSLVLLETSANQASKIPSISQSSNQFLIRSKKLRFLTIAATIRNKSPQLSRHLSPTLLGLK